MPIPETQVPVRFSCLDVLMSFLEQALSADASREITSWGGMVEWFSCRYVLVLDLESAITTSVWLCLADFWFQILAQIYIPACEVLTLARRMLTFSEAGLVAALLCKICVLRTSGRSNVSNLLQ